MTIQTGKPGFAAMLNFSARSGPPFGLNPESDKAHLLGWAALLSNNTINLVRFAVAPFIDRQSFLNLFMDEESLLNTFIGGGAVITDTIERGSLMPSTRISRSVKDG